MMNYPHFALQKSFLVLYGINIYVSSIILIKIIFSELVWIKRGYMGKTQFQGVLCGDLWVGTQTADFI